MENSLGIFGARKNGALSSHIHGKTHHEYEMKENNSLYFESI